MKKIVPKFILTILCLSLITIGTTALAALPNQTPSPQPEVGDGCEVIIQKWDIEYVDNIMVIQSTIKNNTAINLRGTYVFIHLLTPEGELISYTVFEIKEDFPPNESVSPIFIVEIIPGSESVFVLMTDPSTNHIYPICGEDEKKGI